MARFSVGQGKGEHKAFGNENREKNSNCNIFNFWKASEKYQHDVLMLRPPS